MEVAHGCRKFVSGYYALQERRMGALAAVMPDSQMVIDWLELEYHIRLEVAHVSTVLVKGIRTTHSIDAMIGWQLYSESMPSLFCLGWTIYPKTDRVAVTLEPAHNQEVQVAERDVIEEWLVSSPQSACDWQLTVARG